MQGLDQPQAPAWHPEPSPGTQPPAPAAVSTPALLAVPVALGCRHTTTPLPNPGNHRHRPKDGGFHLLSCTCTFEDRCSGDKSELQPPPAPAWVLSLNCSI